ncbi:NfeD family protein [Caldimonas sp. KR1-144]|uniref:NfeD family protein n=1 Tax=Caldimonas sp. KR1-144 TaxID=3400911 RepID=UPI003C07F0CA
MDWSSATTWWVAAGVLIAAELATGTFYLLMLALGMAAAALAAHAGAGFSTQLIVAAAVGAASVTIWHLRRQRQPAGPPAQANRDVNLDIGERVHVPAWSPEGTAEVSYRGAAWRARWAGSGTPAPGEHVIAAIDGSQLLLRR